MNISETAKCSWKHIFLKLIKGSRDATVAFLAILHKTVITAPYAVLIALTFAFFIFHVVTIGTARAERDALNKECMKLTQQVENLRP